MANETNKVLAGWYSGFKIGCSANKEWAYIIRPNGEYVFFNKLNVQKIEDVSSIHTDASVLNTAIATEVIGIGAGMAMSHGKGSKIRNLEKNFIFFEQFRRLIHIQFIPETPIQRFFCYNFPDFLWAYSVGWAIPKTGNRWRKIALSCMFMLSIEFAQLLPFVHGTFDILDILIELLGVILAIIVNDIAVELHIRNILRTSLKTKKPE